VPELLELLMFDLAVLEPELMLLLGTPRIVRRPRFVRVRAAGRSELVAI